MGISLKEYKNFCLKNGLKECKIDSLEMFYVLNYKRGNKYVR